MSVFGRNTLWLTAANSLQQVISFVALFFIARHVNPEAFGLVALAMLGVLISQRILIESIGYCIIQASSVTREYLSAAFYICFVLGVFFSALFYISADFFANLFSAPRLADVIKPLAVIPVLDGVSCIHLAMLRKESRFREVAKRTFWANILSSVTGVCLAYAGAGLWSLVAQQLVLSGVGAFVLILSYRWLPAKRFSFVDVRQIMSFGTPMLASAVMNVFTNRLDVLAIGLVGSPSAVGIYNVAKRVVRTVTDSVVNGAVHVALSDLSANKADVSAMATLFVSRLRLITFFSFPIFFCVGAVSHDLVAVALGAQWAEAAPILSILSIFGVCQLVSLSATNVLVVAGETRIIAVNQIISLVAFVGLLMFAAQDGIFSVAVAFLAQGFLLSFLLIYALNRLRLVSIQSFISAISTVLALAVLSFVLVWFARNSLFENYNELPRLASSVLMYAGLFVSAAWFFAKNDVTRVMNFVSKITGKR